VFASHDAELDVDLADLKETEVECVLAAFLKLSVEQQAEFEAEFQDVNALACEGGVAALPTQIALTENRRSLSGAAGAQVATAKCRW